MKIFIYFQIFLVLSFILNLSAQTNNGSAFDDGFNGIIVRDNYPANQNADFSALSSEKTAITVETWIFPIDIPNQTDENDLISLYSYDRYGKKWYSFKLSLIRTTENNTADIKFRISDGEDEENIGEIISPESIVPETWNHIAATYDESNLRIFVNGVLKNTVSHTGVIRIRETINSQSFYIHINELFNCLGCCSFSGTNIHKYKFSIDRQ